MPCTSVAGDIVRRADCHTAHCTSHPPLTPSPAHFRSLPCLFAAPVRACGLSEDCRHLLAVLGKGFVFRSATDANWCFQRLH
jgi:hypothetical protein